MSEEKTDVDLAAFVEELRGLRVAELQKQATTRRIKIKHYEAKLAAWRLQLEELEAALAQLGAGEDLAEDERPSPSSEAYDLAFELIQDRGDAQRVREVFQTVFGGHSDAFRQAMKLRRDLLRS